MSGVPGGRLEELAWGHRAPGADVEVLALLPEPQRRPGELCPCASGGDQRGTSIEEPKEALGWVTGSPFGQRDAQVTVPKLRGVPHPPAHPVEGWGRVCLREAQGRPPRAPQPGSALPRQALSERPSLWEGRWGKAVRAARTASPLFRSEVAVMALVLIPLGTPGSGLAGRAAPGSSGQPAWCSLRCGAQTAARGAGRSEVPEQRALQHRVVLGRAERRSRPVPHPALRGSSWVASCRSGRSNAVARYPSRALSRILGRYLGRLPRPAQLEAVVTGVHRHPHIGAPRFVPLAYLEFVVKKS